MGFFSPFLGKKMRFFGESGPETLGNLLQYPEKQVTLSPAPSKKGMGPYN